jgi:thiamine monophosphate synthase
VLALGGVTAGNAGEALAAGAEGVALMGAVMRAEDPAELVGAIASLLPAPDHTTAGHPPIQEIA